MKELNIEESIKGIVSNLTDEEKLRWEELNSMRLSFSLMNDDKVSLLASLLEVLL